MSLKQSNDADEWTESRGDSRTASPRLVKNVTAFDQLARRLANKRGPLSTPAFQNHTGPNHQQSNLSSSPPTDSDELVANNQGDASASSRREVNAAHPLRVKWSAWDQISSSGRGSHELSRVLLIAYEQAAFSIWDCSSLDSWSELLRLSSIDTVLSPQIRSRLGRRATLGEIVGAAVVPDSSASYAEHGDTLDNQGPVVAILTAEVEARRSHVLLYSLKSHQIFHEITVPGVARQIKTSLRHIAVTTTFPAVIHVLTSSNLVPLPCSPISDIAPNPDDGTPVFDLGRGGRTLAYATRRPVVASSGAARFDTTPTQPGAGIFAQTGMFGGDGSSSPDEYGSPENFRYGVDARTAGHVGGEVAKRVGQGVLSGVKAISGIGMSYWGTSRTGTDSRGSPQHMNEANVPFSRSAPLPTALSSGQLSPVDIRSPHRRRSGAFLDQQSMTDGAIAVVDLLAASPLRGVKERDGRSTKRPLGSAKTIAHFRPYSQPIALVSLSPGSTQVFTAPSSGHSFDVFEMRPRTQIGVSAMDGSTSSEGKVWHRYRLQRGLTRARATSAVWSDDARLLSVGTGRGTMHLYAVHPTGGKVSLDRHLGPKTTNLADLAPLSVTLSTLSRLRKRSEDTSDSPQIDPTPPSLTFVPHAVSTSSSLRPVSARSPVPSTSYPSRGQPGAARSRESQNEQVGLQFRDCIIFYPGAATAVLHRLDARSKPSLTAEGALVAASRGDVGRMASTAVSGLTQLMMNRGGTSPSASSKVNQLEWEVSSGIKAAWDVPRWSNDSDVKQHISTTRLSDKDSSSSRYSANAEIETFSRSHRVMPRSIYQSQQFNFYILPEDHAAKGLAGSFALLPLQRLETRSEVRIRQGNLSSATGGSGTTPAQGDPSKASEVMFGPQSFDQPIKSAMQTIIDHMDSPSSTPPPPAAFPNGVPGRSGAGTWRHAIPIRASDVNAGLVVGLNGARALGKVGSRAAVAVVSATAASVAARRAGTGAGSKASGPSDHVGSSGLTPCDERDVSSSVSFEDDTVFADHCDGINEGSYSTVGTSHSGGEQRGSTGSASGSGDGGNKVDDRDSEEPWSLDLGQDLEDEIDDNRSPIFPAATHVVVEGLPFDDFDDLELELAPPAPRAHVPGARLDTVSAPIVDTVPDMTGSFQDLAVAARPVPVIDFDSPVIKEAETNSGSPLRSVPQNSAGDSLAAAKTGTTPSLPVAIPASPAIQHLALSSPSRSSSPTVGSVGSIASSLSSSPSGENGSGHKKKSKKRR